MAKVWVVMKNDFPDTVFASEEGAKQYCEQRKTEPESKNRYREGNRWLEHGWGIYWRTYEFELRE
jgi:hypothetical protein